MISLRLTFVTAAKKLEGPRPSSLTTAAASSSSPSPSSSWRTILPARPLSTSAPRLGPKARPAPAAPAASSSGTTKLERKKIPVETNPELLAKYCCINYHVDKTEGGPGPELKDDDYYPDWLWELPVGIQNWYEMDPRTEAYWFKKKRAYQYHKTQLRKARPYGIL